MAGTKRRSTRQAASRKRSIYVDPSSDTDQFDAEDEFEPEPEDEPAQPPPAKRQKVSTRRTKPHTRTKSVVKKSHGQKAKVKPIGAPRRRKHVDEPKDTIQKVFSGLSDGRVPAWTSLPLEILRDIFIFASQPLQVQTRTASDNATWLIKAARTCRAFTLPALEAYYHAPPIHTNLHPHHLLELLEAPKENRYMDYNVKVKSLSIDINRLAYTAHNRGHFDLNLLVAQLPQLQHLELLHPVDEPPFRHVKIRWYQPADLFTTLESCGHRLRSWRWNRRTVKTQDPEEMYNFMATTHSGHAFQYLEKLTVCGYDYTNSAEPAEPLEESDVALPGLATAITVLSALKDLTFISCDIIMEKFLERLPKNLERLELTNCLELTSEMLQSFLTHGGAHLRELVLNHNAALSLAFLTGLKVNCPNLEVLKMDVRNFSERVNSNDAEPLYDQLLSEDAIPTWPSTLRHLSLTHLQRWSSSAAQNLFRSLVDSADSLPHLRYLVLQSHINIPWRDRVGFRDQWIERLERVYLRKSQPPSPYLGSLRQYTLWKQAQASGRALPSDPAGIAGGFESDDDVVTGRRMNHIRITPAKKPRADTGVDIFSESSPEKKREPGPARRSKRVAESQASLSAASPSADDDEDEDDDGDEEDWRKQPEKYIQGLCHVVDIRIDSQRPRENQFTEGDFLDSELSGDEDWQEGADEGVEDGYAW